MQGDIADIAAGEYHSLALRRDGNVMCWGGNSVDQAPPQGVEGDFVAIAAGTRHSLALQRNGSVACWGDNFAFNNIAAGGLHSLALRSDGSVECWGENDNGQAPTLWTQKEESVAFSHLLGN